MTSGLEGRTAIVCGASSGLGLATAEHLRRAGADVVAVARRAETLEPAAERIGASPLVADLAEDGAADRVVEHAVRLFGGLDVLVWNTGGPAPGPALKVDEHAADAAFRAMVLPLLRLVGAAVPHLRRSPAGRIVAITASTVKEPTSQVAVSSLVRPGIAGYLKTLAGELAPDGVTVNCVAPGRIHTSRASLLYPDGVPASAIADIPMGRLGTPEEFAAVIGFLVSPAASYVTGTTIAVDGGLSRSIF
ncbi:SDR family oxidoreductase [Umezawaea endophytica]|uniref:SDR family oxidoreductase n=1 Tax=Umezawaea endophytica TaxID=1654476 RepID=A0A9X3AK78_9PSEU|nr:SDR family oxidoreductase [Umezawaea endophytica]MCS7482505.1 SDR family oxidoreductase [Umezawaea endophytica]